MKVTHFVHKAARFSTTLDLRFENSVLDLAWHMTCLASAN